MRDWFQRRCFLMQGHWAGEHSLNVCCARRVLSTMYLYLTFSVFYPEFCAIGTNTVPFVQMWKLRQREVKLPTQNHTGLVEQGFNRLVTNRLVEQGFKSRLYSSGDHHHNHHAYWLPREYKECICYHPTTYLFSVGKWSHFTFCWDGMICSSGPWDPQRF